MKRVYLAVTGLAFASGCDCYSSRPTDGGDGPGLDTRDAGGEDEDGGGDDVDAGSIPTDAGTPKDAGSIDDAAPDSGEFDAGPIDKGPLRLDDGDFANHPKVAMDGDGNATVVWGQRDGTAARRFEPATGWLDTEELGPGIDPHVDFNERGDGVVVWRDIDARLTYARIWSPGAGWLVDDELGPGGNFVEVAIDGDGNAIALFSSVDADGTEHVHSSRYEPATGWSAEELIDDASLYTRTGAVAVNEAGDFAAVWTRFSDVDETLWTSRWSGGAWTAASQIGSQPSVARPRLAVAGSGDAYAIWDASEGEVGGVWTAREIASGDFGAPEYLAEMGDGTTSVAVSAASDDSAFVAWEDGSEALSARANPGEGFGDVWNLRGPDGATDRYEAIDVAADEVGGATVAWSQDDGGSLGIWTNRWIAGLAWGDAVRVDPVEEPDDSHWPDVDVAPDGTAAIVWQDADGFSGVWGVIVEP
jgi:hypothetical protein